MDFSLFGEVINTSYYQNSFIYGGRLERTWVIYKAQSYEVTDQLTIHEIQAFLTALSIYLFPVFWGNIIFIFFRFLFYFTIYNKLFKHLHKMSCDGARACQRQPPAKQAERGGLGRQSQLLGAPQQGWWGDMSPASHPTSLQPHSSPALPHCHLI